VSYACLVLDRDRTERGEELLDEVVLLVVERGAAEGAEAERAATAASTPSPSRQVSSHVSFRVAITRSAIMSIAVSRSSDSQRVEYGARYFTRSSRSGFVTRLLLAAPLGQSRPREIGLFGSPSIWLTSPFST
jgi:hypothetical protein